jgi:spore germination protein
MVRRVTLQRARTVVLTSLLPLLVWLAVGDPARAAIPATPPAVTGFQVAGDPTSLIDRSAPALSTVGVDGVELRANGRGITGVGAAGQELAGAHADHLRAELLVSNYSEKIQDFSEPLGHRLLGHRQNILRVAQRLAQIVRTRHWNGICVDLESLHRRDAAGLTRFLRALHRDLPAGSSLSMALMNATSAGGFAADGYQLSAIGRATTRVILMAYDEHGPWERTPGAVGAAPWARAGLAVLLRSVPGAKVDVGVAGYGYGWRPHRVVTLSDARARALCAGDGVTPVWDAGAAEWTASLRDGSVLWWSDNRSYVARVQLAVSLGLHGVAVWSLGLSDPLTPVS